MTAIMDILVSMVIGGALLLIILDANDYASENHSVYNGNMLVQEMLISTAQQIEGEVRNMGFGIPERVAPIVRADSTRIHFLVDLERNGGNPDTVKYWLGDVNELSSTQNELDRFLYRAVNNQPAVKVGVVTFFHLKYYIRSGARIPSPVPSDRLSEISTVETKMEVQNPYAVYKKRSQVAAGERTANYSSSLWQHTRVTSKNTRR